MKRIMTEQKRWAPVFLQAREREMAYFLLKKILISVATEVVGREVLVTWLHAALGKSSLNFII